jgi:Zn-dependent M32 family carboxypeptidase
MTQTLTLDDIKAAITEMYNSHRVAEVTMRAAKELEDYSERKEIEVRHAAESLAYHHLKDIPRERWQEIFDQAVKLATAWDDAKSK